MATAASPFANSFLDPTKGTTLAGGPPPAGPGSTTLPASFGGPVPAGQTPPPSVNAGVVYTDASGRGYNPNELQTAVNDPSFMADPLNARARDIVQQYGTVTNPQGAAKAAPAGAPSGGGSPFLGAGAAIGGAIGMADPRSSAFFDTLMSRLDQTPQVDPNDPAIKSSTDAYAAQQERQRRSSLSQMAEKGGDNQNLTAVDRSMAESAGQHTGAFQAGLINEERQARRSQIQNILSLGGSFLTSEQQMALQKELSDMNLAERGYEFDTNQAYLTSPFAPGYNS